jgi:hypothetical protein
MDVNLYFYIESLALTQPQREILVEQLKLIGRRDQDGNPKNRNHWRVRPDGLALIFEAWWDEDHLTAVNFRNRLAAIFGVAQASITYNTTSTGYGPLVTYSYNSTARLRVGVFGGVGATYQESQAAALAYLAANLATWE